MSAEHPQIIRAVKCPKCGHVSNDRTECPACGIDFAGYARFLDHHNQEHRELPAPLAFVGSARALFVQQKEDLVRIFTGWQTRNHYVIANEAGEPLAYLAERDTSVLSTLTRLFLRQNRPFTIDLVDPTGVPILQLVRRFAWFFPRMDVIDPASGRILGFVQKRFALIRNFHHLCDGLGAPLGKLRSALFGGRTIGDALLGNQCYSLYDASDIDTGAFISRQWNGMLNRLFTDQDTFYVDLPAGLPALTKLLLLCASICIDFEAFESQSGARRNGLLGDAFSVFNNRDGGNI